ncbi:unnamed protein product [Chrysoparadoxa australica]
MATPRGGTHVNAITSQITKRLSDYINKKHPSITVSPAQVKQHLFLFVNALIENPSFDSQMKESLTSRPESFGSSCILPRHFFKSIVDHSGIVERVVEVATAQEEARQKGKLGKSMSGKGKAGLLHLHVPKLDDAHKAGTKESHMCTLLLTEGDSAKAVAVAGLEVLGREYFGVFPLRGKFLNVRDASLKEAATNQEISNLCTILGLDVSKTYENGLDKAMRYGKIMLMTDQDHDGFHIKGLLINFFHHFWPHLAKLDGFIEQLSTPLIKVRKASSRSTSATPGSVHEFFSVPEYETWQLQQQQQLGEKEFSREWKVKYYKGLGTSSAKEAKGYFENLSRHVTAFKGTSDRDSEAIDMVFKKSRSAERKVWLLSNSGDVLPHCTPGGGSTNSDSDFDSCDNHVTVEDFIHKDLIQYSHADNVRSIPSSIDGLKPSQRKVLYACFKRNLTNEIKVAQLAGYCSEHTGYHHGEASLTSTIVNMAQDFVGSNNLPLLHGSGQFGTRLMGGKDAASPRYIFTHLSKWARLLFPQVDDRLLCCKRDDGSTVEPYYYVPVVPVLLVNGSQGIGTGWSTNIPPCNPLDLICRLESMLKGGDSQGLPLKVQVKREDKRRRKGQERGMDEEQLTRGLSSLMPWVKGFKGVIESTQKSSPSFVSHGIVEAVRVEGASGGAKETQVCITELPVGKWTSDYKEHLLKMCEQGKIKSFTEHHTPTEVKFLVQMKVSQIKSLCATGGLRGYFSLSQTISTSNMHAFDARGKMCKYNSADDILQHFYTVRLELYKRRRQLLEAEAAYQAEVLSNRAHFLKSVIGGTLDIVMQGKLSKRQLEDKLLECGFATLSELKAAYSAALPRELGSPNAATTSSLQPTEHAKDGDSTGAVTKVSSGDFDYLLNAPLASFTVEKLSELTEECTKAKRKLKEVKSQSPKAMWLKDLGRLRDALGRSFS